MNNFQAGFQPNADVRLFEQLICGPNGLDCNPNPALGGPPMEPCFCGTFANGEVVEIAFDQCDPILVGAVALADGTCISVNVDPG